MENASSSAPGVGRTDPLGLSYFTTLKVYINDTRPQTHELSG